MNKTIHATDSLSMEGELSIYIRPEGHSDKLLYFRGKNRITNNARKYLLRMVTETPSTLTPNPITYFKVGTGGVAQTLDGTETDLFTALDPSGGDPYTAAVTFGFPDAPLNMVAEYAFEVATSELVGQVLSETGLFCDNNWDGEADIDTVEGQMFNIKLFPAITKSAAFALVFVWRVNFSGAC